jgi:hypothetical protein
MRVVTERQAQKLSQPNLVKLSHKTIASRQQRKATSDSKPSKCVKPIHGASLSMIEKPKLKASLKEKVSSLRMSLASRV